MKIKLLHVIAVAAIAVFSSAVFASGNHCDSMHKNMSAEQWQQFKKNHDWVYSDDAGEMDKSASHDKESGKSLKSETPTDKNGTHLMGV